jgi:hypothetical protein
VKTWLLLEYQGAMGAQALEESDIPTEVRDHLNRVLNSLADARLLLIKSGAEAPPDRIGIYVVNGRERDPYYLRYELERYEDLLDLDLSTEPDGGRRGAKWSEGRAPLHLVCTNGRRDPCCAQEGLPVFSALNIRAPRSVWQSSHLGGHRFAANVLVFPYGILYGRVSPEDADVLLAAGSAGEILIERYRGRACYDKAVQAAEAHLRMQTGRLGLEDFRWESTEELEGGSWRVVFTDLEGDRHSLDLRLDRSETVDYVSCRDDKQSPVVHYRLLNYVSA